MVQAIREMNLEDLHLFGKIVAQLEHHEGDRDVREAIFLDIVRLVRADFGASYVWNRRSRQFEHGLIHNMDPDNIRRYVDWYQYHDPHTFQLRERRRATLVEEITPHDVLKRTEFYNDFLQRDGLHHGINIFLFDGDEDIGDFRLWRAEHRPDFGEREITILDALAPYIKRAILRSRLQFDQLTSREREVAILVARGFRDREIGSMLGIGFSTVRTHVNRAMEKKGCMNRAELAGAIMASKVSGNARP